MAQIADVYQRIARFDFAAGDRDATMQRCVDLMWEQLHQRDVSWLGFYIDHPNEPDDRRLILGPHRDKPACSPIGLHGVCGQALISGCARIVTDVQSLGRNYVACDPRDRAELVVPLFEAGRCWGVFDLDSFTPGRFTGDDCIGCRHVLKAAGFQTDM